MVRHLNIAGNVRNVGSFKLKLVIYFLLLSLLPIAAAFWGFTQVAGQSETRRVDARLQTGMRALLATDQEQLDAAQRRATVIAGTKAFQRELERGDGTGLAQMFRNQPEVSVESIDGFLVHSPPIFAATRQAAVLTTKNGTHPKLSAR